MSGPSSPMAQIEAWLRPHGLMPRGLVSFCDGDGPDLATGATASSVVLIGHAGSSFWSAFSAWRDERADGGGDDPLDAWSEAVIAPLAQALDATAYYPSQQPYQPFQRWAVAAEGLSASPLGILIHPDYGLWHGYRAALGFSEKIEGVAGKTEAQEGRARSPSPCETCVDRPCISHCPVAALASGHFDVLTCRTYLATPAGQGGCIAAGCAARAACPVGQSYHYLEEQLRFHMRALHLPVG